MGTCKSRSDPVTKAIPSVCGTFKNIRNFLFYDKISKIIAELSSIVSLTLLRRQLVKYMLTKLSNALLSFVEKM